MIPYNDHRPRRTSLLDKLIASPTPITWLLLGINVVILAGLELSGGSTSVPNLLRWGAKFGPAIADGDYWRLFTPMFLHVGVAHLVTNSLGLILFGRLVERYFGSRSFLAIYLLAGVFGNIASYAAVSNGVGAGASGAVFGIIGAYGAFLFRNRSISGSMAQSTLGGLGIIVGVNLLFGFSVSGIDNWAHIGGLVGGFLIAYRLVPIAEIVPTRVVSARLEPPESSHRPYLPDRPDLQNEPGEPEPTADYGEAYYQPVLVRATTLALIEVLFVSAITIIATTWVISSAYPIR